MPEIIYAISGDIREELNSGAVPGTKNYKDETQIRGDIITRSARRATREVNIRLKNTYPDEIPFAVSGNVPPEIEGIANDLGVYYVLRAKHRGPGPLSATVREQYYNDPLASLKEIVDSGVPLSELGSQGSSVSETSDTNADYEAVFDMDEVENQRVDPDRLGDIASDRRS